MTRAEQLHITEGPVWVLGTSDEERALLDPLPDGVEVVVDRDVTPDDPLADDADDLDAGHEGHAMAAAVIVVEDLQSTPELLDDTLPRVGSVPLVWIVLPTRLATVEVPHVEQMAQEYGWSPAERVDLDDGWAAIRLAQD
jgi:hypothetical protein